MHWKYALYSFATMHDAAKIILSGIKDLKPQLKARVMEFETARRLAGLKGTGSHQIAIKDALVPAAEMLTTCRKEFP